MKALLNIIKKAFLWSYARNTWQWDVLCVVILIFIFLTPKSWFTNGERHKPARTVVIGAELVENESDRAKLERQIRSLTGQSDARIDNVRARRDNNGKTIAYEVDIH
jgi:uncharacterized membrane protein YfhO